jgi:hypothetical protein
MFARSFLLIGAAMLLPAIALAADPPTATGKGQSQMSVGFTPPEKKADGPKPWTREDLYRARHAHEHQSGNLPRCEQDRLLTDKTPCDPNR